MSRNDVRTVLVGIVLLGAALLAAIAAQAQPYPEPADQDRRSVCRRRRGRHRREDHRTAAFGSAEATGDRRQPSGCQREHRHGAGRQGGAGRLHVADGLERHRDQHGAVPAARVRRSARFRARREDRLRAAGDRRARLVAGEIAEGPDRDGESRARASSPTPRRATAARDTSQASCSNRRRRSTSCTFPTRAARRRSPTCWASASRSCRSIRSR